MRFLIAREHSSCANFGRKFRSNVRCAASARSTFCRLFIFFFAPHLITSIRVFVRIDAAAPMVHLSKLPRVYDDGRLAHAAAGSNLQVASPVATLSIPVARRTFIPHPRVHHAADDKNVTRIYSAQGGPAVASIFMLHGIRTPYLDRNRSIHADVLHRPNFGPVSATEIRRTILSHC